MEWNEKLQIIIDYVENHLQRSEEAINSQEISKIAGCSYSFFQKVFAYMNNMSFAEYIRYRKMTLAGYDLKSTKMKIIDISYKYDYDSPTSFTKAFQQFHGMTPKEARLSQSSLRVFPKMQISLTQKYTWKIEHKPSFRLIGKTIHLSKDNAVEEIPKFWNQSLKSGLITQLMSLNIGKQKGLIGIYLNYDNQSGEMDYGIMVHSLENIINDFQVIEVPETTWAVFDCIGAVPQAIQQGWTYLNEEWFQYPFRHANCPEIEWFSNGNSFSDDYFSQIWIPIVEE